MAERAPYRKQAEVREEILQTAEKVFATRAPSEVTVREIAEAGGFHHSLVHRHFDTKENLVAEVVQRTLNDYVTAVSAYEDPADGIAAAMAHMADHPASFQAMASALLDERRGAVDDLFPGFAAHRSQLEATRRAGDVDLDVLTIALMAFAAGWAFLERRWMVAGGVGDDEQARVRAEVAGILARVVERETRPR
jgi:AcrR family transcriptional regulator